MTERRVVHEPAGTAEGEEIEENEQVEKSPTEQIIATEVEIADSALAQSKGLMFRSSIPDDFALSLEVGGGGLLPIPRGPARQIVHMLFVQMSLDVVWLVDDQVTKVATMRPWRSIGVAKADRILELPAGNAAGVEPGDTVRIETVESQAQSDEESVSEAKSESA